MFLLYKWNRDFFYSRLNHFLMRIILCENKIIKYIVLTDFQCLQFYIRIKWSRIEIR